MKDPDIRWRQRFQNYQNALARLTAAVALSRQRALSDLERQGLVQAFEFSHELAWNVLESLSKNSNGSCFRKRTGAKGTECGYSFKEYGVFTEKSSPAK